MHFPSQTLVTGLIAGWSWYRALSFTNPLERSLITGWSWCRAFSFTNPLQILVRKAWLQAGAVLRPIHQDFSLPMQLLGNGLS